MAGYSGSQYLLSSNGFAHVAEDHDTIVLASGKVLTAAVSGNGAAVTVYEFNPATKTTKILSTLAAEPYLGFAWVRMYNPQLVANKDGGYTVVAERPVGFDLAGAGDDRLVMQRYDAKGNEKGKLKTLAKGWIESVEVETTGNGFFVGHRNRDADNTKFEYTGTFYRADGKVLKKFDLQTRVPEAEKLKNGNVALVWQDDPGGTITAQVFKPNGAKVANAFTVPNTSIHTLNDRVPKVAALPNGGFVSLFSLTAAGTDLYFQRHKPNGKPVGKLVKVELPDRVPYTGLEGPFDIEVLKDGNFLIAWHERDSSDINGRDSDIRMAVYTPTGDLVFGPQFGPEILTQDQGDLQLVKMKNGNLLLSFNDDNVKQFSYVESIQGVVIQTPNFFWKGNGQNNTKSGTKGNDVMIGLGGKDTLKGLNGHDYLKGGNGDDTLFGGGGNDDLLGEIGNDTLRGDAGADQLFGGAGRDTLLGGGGADSLYGEDGPDTIRGGGGNDTVEGGAGNDTIFGDAGNDILDGNDDNDTINGGAGNDTIQGGDGRDVLNGGPGFDNLDGGAGNDRVLGGDDADIVRGGDDDDVVKGGNGDDNIAGGKGNDRMFGENGDDRFFDDEGDDIMNGGAGADTFNFVSSDFGKDRITDFTPGEDVLDMGWTAYGLQTSGGGTISVSDTAGGVLFEIDANNSVLLEGLTMAQLTAGTDYIIVSPI